MNNIENIDLGKYKTPILAVAIMTPPDDTIEKVISFVVPEEFTESANASYATADLPFRTDAIYMYEKTEGRVFQFDLKLIALSSATAKKDVEDKVNLLLASQYPVVNDSNTIIGMPTALLTFGKRFQSIRGILTDISIKWSGPWSEDSFYQVAEVSFQFKHMPLKKIDLKATRNDSPNFNSVLQGSKFGKSIQTGSNYSTSSTSNIG